MPHDLENQLFVGAIALIVVALAVFAEWWERRTEAPIMKQRINAGSDEFLRRRGSIWKAATRQTRNAFNLPEFRED